jgi:hypothetical protein
MTNESTPTYDGSPKSVPDTLPVRYLLPSFKDTSHSMKSVTYFTCLSFGVQSSASSPGIRQRFSPAD